MLLTQTVHARTRAAVHTLFHVVTSHSLPTGVVISAFVVLLRAVSPLTLGHFIKAPELVRDLAWKHPMNIKPSFLPTISEDSEGDERQSCCRCKRLYLKTQRSRNSTLKAQTAPIPSKYCVYLNIVNTCLCLIQ